MPATSAKQAKDTKIPKDPADDYSLIRLAPKVPYRSQYTVQEIDRAIQKVMATRKAREAQPPGTSQ